jgi:hypothetical protein
MKIPTLMFASLLFSNGCAGPSEPIVVPVGRSFELAPGQEALVDGLSVSFQQVSADSRCPIDAVCVWEGDAAVGVLLRAASEAAASRELHTSGQMGGPETTYAGYTVRLEKLQPANQASQPIRPYDYRATLLVER